VLRHLEGWELGVIAVVVAIVGALIVVPLRVAPEDVPLPVADERRVAERESRDRELAARVVPLLERDIANVTKPASDEKSATLPQDSRALYDLRAFGEAFRAYGTAEASPDMYEVVRTHKKLLDAVNAARALGDDALLGVRAYEKQRFVNELARWETSAESEELRGLGGNFVSMAARYGWSNDGKLAMNDALRGIFFERRWNEVTGLTEAPFALSLDEYRAFFRFLLARPPVEVAFLGPREACLMADEWRLKKVNEVARIDAAYPLTLARGILLYRVGNYSGAVEALRAYLNGDEHAEYALRARNYLAEAAARAAEVSSNP
jgi:hypothetical protein